MRQLIACDFFTVEALTLKTLYALFCIELGSRKVHRADVTANPNETWVTQQARQVMWELGERNPCDAFCGEDESFSYPGSDFDKEFGLQRPLMPEN